MLKEIGWEHLASNKFCASSFYLPTWSKEKCQRVLSEGKGLGKDDFMTENRDYFVDTDRVLSYLKKHGHRWTSSEVTPIGPRKSTSGALLSAKKVTIEKKKSSESRGRFTSITKGKAVTHVVTDPVSKKTRKFAVTSSKEKKSGASIVTALTPAEPMDCDGSGRRDIQENADDDCSDDSMDSFDRAYLKYKEMKSNELIQSCVMEVRPEFDGAAEALSTVASEFESFQLQNFPNLWRILKGCGWHWFYTEFHRVYTFSVGTTVKNYKDKLRLQEAFCSEEEVVLFVVRQMVGRGYNQYGRRRMEGEIIAF